MIRAQADKGSGGNPMSVSPVSSAATIQPELQTPVLKAAVSQSSSTTPPAYTVSLSSSALKSVSGDVDHDGDSH